MAKPAQRRLSNHKKLTRRLGPLHRRVRPGPLVRSGEDSLGNWLTDFEGFTKPVPEKPLLNCPSHHNHIRAWSLNLDDDRITQRRIGRRSNREQRATTAVARRRSLAAAARSWVGTVSR